MPPTCSKFKQVIHFDYKTLKSNFKVIHYNNFNILEYSPDFRCPDLKSRFLRGLCISSQEIHNKYIRILK